MYIGAAYYPELWNEAELDKDIERCKEYGINVLRVGEFAWGKLERQEGVFELAWLERTVDRLYEAGIATVLCTPTCTPPRWFLDKYPEVRTEAYDGVREAVSSRCHVCKTSPLMRAKNRQIVTALGERFGKHRGVIGWQIDNELFFYRGGCYCKLCREAFRGYLKNKYGTVERLNESWGMSRWSLDYPSFASVEPPYPDQWRHPSLRTEWRSFQCEQIYSYANEQADILHSLTDVPVGTDMMPMNTLSYYKINENLDVVQFNHYDRAERLPRLAFDYDFLRPIKKHPFWVTETQVGWNGSETAENGFRPMGNCYANTWQPIARGGEMNMYWHFRAHSAGHELAHGAVFSACGRAYRVSEEIARASADIERCADFLKSTSVRSKIAVHYSSVSEHNFASAPILKGLEYKKTVMDKFYAAFSHRNVDVIDLPHSLDGYSVLLSPFVTAFDESARARITDFVENGGLWIVGPMSDIMSDFTAKPTDAPFFFLEELVGAYTKYRLPVANDVFRAYLVSDGSDFPVSECYDAFEARSCNPLAVYTDCELEGYCAAVEKRLGKGKIVLLGTVPSHEFLRRIAGIESIAEASENVHIVERFYENGASAGLIVQELENREGELTLPNGEYDELISSRRLSGHVRVDAYEVLVLKRA